MALSTQPSEDVKKPVHVQRNRFPGTRSWPKFTIFTPSKFIIQAAARLDHAFRRIWAPTRDPGQASGHIDATLAAPRPPHHAQCGIQHASTTCGGCLPPECNWSLPKCRPGGTAGGGGAANRAAAKRRDQHPLGVVLSADTMYRDAASS
jgi:hypothetical protein